MRGECARHNPRVAGGMKKVLGQSDENSEDGVREPCPISKHTKELDNWASKQENMSKCDSKDRSLVR